MGSIQSKNGIYEGEYKNDEAHGKGIFTFSNGNIYEGEFKYGNITRKRYI